jgi:hypothetical protein
MKMLRQAQQPLQRFPCRVASELPSYAPRLCASLPPVLPWRQPPGYPLARTDQSTYSVGTARFNRRGPFITILSCRFTSRPESATCDKHGSARLEVRLG